MPELDLHLNGQTGHDGLIVITEGSSHFSYIVNFITSGFRRVCS